MDKIKCEVIRDLMPLVADDVASAESKALVNGHMESCEVCKAYFAGMTAQIVRSAVPDDGPTSTFISFSKQMEKRFRMKKVLTALTAALVALCVVIVGGCVVFDKMNTNVPMPIEKTKPWLWRENNGEVNLAIQMASDSGWYHNVGWYHEGDVFYMTPYEPEWKLWNKGTRGGLSKEFYFDLLWENGTLYYCFSTTNSEYNIETGWFDRVEKEYKIPIRYVRWGNDLDYVTIYEEGDTIPTREEVYELVYPTEAPATPKVSVSPAPTAVDGDSENLL